MDDDAITIRLDRPHEVLAYIPYRFGFVPTESLALLAVLEPTPDTLAVGLAARLDIADLTDPEILAAARTGVLTQMAMDPTVGAVVVVYTDAPLEDVRAGRGPGGQVLAAWLRDFPYADPTAAMIVTPRVFACVECAEPPCCPTEGHPVERLSETAIAAHMVLGGEMLAESRDALGCPRGAEPERARSAAQAATRERRAMGRHRPEQARRWRGRVLDDFAAMLAQAGPGGSWPPDAALLGRLGAALTDPHLRDAVVAWTLGGSRIRPESPRVLDVFEGVLSGCLESPATEHLNASAAVLTEVARHAAPNKAGHALAVLGWLAWWRGEGARADVLQRQCFEEDPRCRLGRLLAQVLDGGVRPGWARPQTSVAPGPG